MAEETRYRTVIEFAGDDTPIEPILQRLEQRMQALVDRAQGVFGGGASGGAAGGSGGMPVPPPAPASPAALSGGGGGAMAPGTILGPNGQPLTGGGSGSVPLPQAPPSPLVWPGGGGAPMAPMSPAAWAPEGGPNAPGGMPGGGSSAAYDAYWAGMEADRQARADERSKRLAMREATRFGALGDVGSAMQAMGTGVMGFHPGVPLMAATALGTSFLGRNAMEQREAGNPNMSRALSAAAAGLGLMGGIGAAGLAMNYGIAQERGSVDMLSAQGRVNGSVVDIDAGADLGYSPMESAGINYQFANSAGWIGSQDRIERTTGPMSGSALLDMTRRGISAGSIGAYAGMWSPGGGAVDGTGRSATDMAAVATGNGLRGSRVDQWLQTIASHTGQMIENGLPVNMDKFEGFIRRMNGTPGFEEQASQMPRYAASLDGARGGARQQLLGGLGDIYQQALLAKALSQPGGIAGAVKFLEGAGPGDVLKIGKGAAGDLAPAALAALTGMPMGLAERAVRGLGREMGGVLPDFPDEGIAVSRELARGDTQRLKRVTTDSARDLVGQVEAMKLAMVTMGEVAGNLITAIEKLVKALTPKDPKNPPKNPDGTPMDPAQIWGPGPLGY